MKLELFKHIDKCAEALINIENSFKSNEKLDLNELNKNNTAIVFIDIIEGFVNKGVLSSSRALNILPYVKKLNESSIGFHRVYFIDEHSDNSSEFTDYPKHCVVNSGENILVDNLVYDEYDSRSISIHKNSTNGFHVPLFTKWLQSNSNVDNFIICGLVTDICVMQFALTLKAYLNQFNKKSNVSVIMEAVETFNLEQTNHLAELMNVFALYNMHMNGIKILSLL